MAAVDLARGRQAADWPDLASPPQPAAAATDWQLPPPQPSEWDQCAQLAVQIADEPALLLAHLADTNLALAGRAALALGSHRMQAAQLADLRRRLLARSQDAATGLPQRIEAGELLGLLGDDIRYESGTGPEGDAYLVPRWVSHWLPVPAGKRQMGGLTDRTDSANTIEVNIPPGLRLAFAPVTNAEFRCFIEAGGYGGQDDVAPPPWWQGEAAQRWWHGEQGSDGQRLVWLAAERRNPPISLSKGAPSFANPLQPVVGVSLFEARAYARWLSFQTGRLIRLPFEAEWEVAARGGVQRTWPWGGDGEDAGRISLADRMNFVESLVRRTTPVGVFPAGCSPEGFVDLAGQVLEWTDSVYTRAGLQTDLAMAAAPNDNLYPWRVMRGGALFYAAAYCRPAFRWGRHPAIGIIDFGFRLLCCPIQEP